MKFTSAMAGQITELQDGLTNYDERRGFHGPVKQISMSGDWGPALAEVPALSDASWRHKLPKVGRIPIALIAACADGDRRVVMLLVQGRCLRTRPGSACGARRRLASLPTSGRLWQAARSADGARVGVFP